METKQKTAELAAGLAKERKNHVNASRSRQATETKKRATETKCSAAPEEGGRWPRAQATADGWPQRGQGRQERDNLGLAQQDRIHPPTKRRLLTSESNQAPPNRRKTNGFAPVVDKRGRATGPARPCQKKQKVRCWTCLAEPLVSSKNDNCRKRPAFDPMPCSPACFQCRRSSAEPQKQCAIERSGWRVG